MMMEQFDLAVIGGGPAGYKAAEMAAKGGLKTALYEKKALGGTCLNVGCIPTKALLHCANIYTAAKEGERFGVKAPGIQFDHGAAMAHKGRTVRALVGGVEQKMKKAGVAVVTAAAQIGGKTIDGFQVAAGGQTYAARRLLLCPGSVPVLPPIPGLREQLEAEFAVTSTQMLDMMQVPAKLVVIGGGVIGLEMASYYRKAGAQVEVVEMLPRIGGAIDGKIASQLLNVLEKSGIRFRLCARVTRLLAGSVVFEQDGTEQAIEADRTLVCVGRKPFVADLGLESIGVTVERGAVVADEFGRTSVGGVFAAGDVTGKSMLAHTAYRQAEVCVNTMLGKEDRMNYDAIPAVIYTHPEVAWVGLTEEAARARGLDVRVVELPLRYSGRYLAENPSGNDLCILVADKATHEILGVHMSGSYASEIIYGAAMMIERGLRVEDVRHVIFPHPTVSEILLEALSQAF